MNSKAEPHGETPLDEAKLMSSETCAEHILNAIEKRKRSLILTLQGKETVLINRFLPSVAENLIRKFFFKDGKLVK